MFAIKTRRGELILQEGEKWVHGMKFKMPSPGGQVKPEKDAGVARLLPARAGGELPHWPRTAEPATCRNWGVRGKPSAPRGTQRAHRSWSPVPTQLCTGAEGGSAVRSRSPGRGESLWWPSAQGWGVAWGAGATRWAPPTLPNAQPGPFASLRRPLSPEGPPLVHDSGALCFSMK